MKASIMGFDQAFRVAAGNLARYRERVVSAVAHQRGQPEELLRRRLARWGGPFPGVAAPDDSEMSKSRPANILRQTGK
jgi:hypothetical protein